MFANDEALAAQISAAATATDEPFWRLPLERRYRGELNSPTADLRNLGSSPNGGAITAALFLEEFVGGLPWAHLDIAGTAQTFSDTQWHTAGCSGFGARALLQVACDFQAPEA
jgi:leucyl aminopeptidase